MKKLLRRIGRWLCREDLWAIQNEMTNLRWRCEDLEELFPEMNYAHQVISKQIMWIRAQLMNVRVAQAERPRVGWEVMAYIPEEVLQVVKKYGPKDLAKFKRLVADVLIDQAIRGILHVNAQGKINALVFAPMNVNAAPAAPEWCQVVFEGDTGKLKLSERLPRLKSEAEQLKQLK
jgi:hypothetical protein